MRIATNAGHSAKVPGASGSGKKEHVMARQINKKFIAFGKARGVGMTDATSEAGTSSAILSHQVSKSNAAKVDVAVSHHLNAGGGTGVEVWYYHNSNTGRALAQRVSEALAKHYGIKNRGAKADNTNRHGGLYFLSKTHAPAILIEWGFIDSASDMAKIYADIDGGVNAALDALGAPKTASPKPAQGTQTTAPKQVVAKPAKVATKASKVAQTPKAPNISRLLRIGSKGTDVRDLQAELNKRNVTDARGSRLIVDGRFGVRTTQALMKYQKSKKLRADGIAGKNTAVALGWTWKK